MTGKVQTQFRYYSTLFLQGAFTVFASMVTILSSRYFIEPTELGVGFIPISLIWEVWIFGLSGLLISTFRGFPGRYILSFPALGYPIVLCVRNLSTYIDYGLELIAPTKEEYFIALVTLIILAFLMIMNHPLRRMIPLVEKSNLQKISRIATRLWVAIFVAMPVWITLVWLQYWGWGVTLE